MVQDRSANFQQALARALYLQTPTLILDDPLSAVEPETVRKILENLFGADGLVRRWPCTVIMTTSIGMYLRLYRSPMTFFC